MSIEIVREAGVQTIRFARPEKKNAVTEAMYEELTRALKDGDGDDDVSVHLFTGTGGIYCAGNDINDFLAFATKGGLGEPVLDFLHALATTAKPMIAAVDGLSVGVGTTIALSFPKERVLEPDG